MENLGHLMATYFHQDWWDEYGGVWESAVDDFVRRERRRVDATRDEVADLLATNGSDKTLGEVLDALGNFRDPGNAPDAHRHWLTSIRDRLAESPTSQTP